MTLGAGFLGAELLHRLAQAGRRVFLLQPGDDSGSRRRLGWLVARHGPRLTIVSTAHLSRAVRQVGCVLHLGNDDGPLLDLVARRRLPLVAVRKIATPAHPPPLVAEGLRVRPVDVALAARGLREEEVSSFAGDAVLVQARAALLPWCVLQIGEVLGPARVEGPPEGWVSELVGAALDGLPIPLEGDGRDVSDLLFVDDAVKAVLAAAGNVYALAGGRWNVGGGPGHSLSPLELTRALETSCVTRPAPRRGEAVEAAGLWAVLDSARFRSVTGWTPRVEAAVAVGRLLHQCLCRVPTAHVPVALEAAP